MHNKNINNIRVSNLEIKNLNENGYFIGYASVFNIRDLHNDIIMPGAFAKSLETTEAEKIKILWQHKHDFPIGHCLSIKEDEYGLIIEGKLILSISSASEAYLLMKHGIIDSLSIGYNVIKSTFSSDRKTRYITQIELWEVSLVTFPANRLATILEVKDDAYLLQLIQRAIAIFK